MTRKVAIVQARMGSTRFPGKVLADLAGAPMLERQLARLSRARMLDEIVVATTTMAEDDAVVGLSARLGYRYFRGDAHDVLRRYLDASRDARADLVVRVTGDCPLIDPDVVDRVVDALIAGPADYASNVIRRTYPRGLDTEALHSDVLARTERLAREPAWREHVTLFIYSGRPDLWILRSVESELERSDLRWTVDLPEDLTAMRSLYEELNLASYHRPYAEILAHVQARSG